MAGNKAADLKIVTVADPVTAKDFIQVKTGKPSYINQSLRQAKYDGMQKVVVDDVKGYDTCVRCPDSGVAGKPISNEAANAMVANPEQHFDSMRPSVVQDMVKAGAGGAAIGGATGELRLSTISTTVIDGVALWLVHDVVIGWTFHNTSHTCTTGCRLMLL